MFTRREFIASTGAIVCTAMTHPLSAASAEARPLVLSPARRRSLMAALAIEGEHYDAAAKMVNVSAGMQGYHTKLRSRQAHGTRVSLTYAAALLDSTEPGHLQRAQEILRTVIPLQDQNPANKTYGIWSWYLEEPLDKMSPPDWNWADFCGVQLLHAWIHHRDRLDRDLAASVRDAIGHAARSIKKRDVSLSYTNIAIMGTYVTLVAGEQFADEELRRYAKERLRRFHVFTMEQGSLTEYNSPTYTIVALTELSRMLLHVEAADDRKLVQELNDFAWKHVATHFHAPTRQWAGPHSRSYGDDLRKKPQTLGFLKEATGVNLISDEPLPLGIDAYRLPLKCPKELVSRFGQLDAPRTTVETFSKRNEKKVGSKTAVIGTTYLHPKFTLGTANRGELWNQRRPLIAYWGTPEEMTFVRLRFLHDGYDYTSALVFTAQHEGAALVTVGFASDYGDTHPNLDLPPVRGQLKAKDMRLRFEFGGSVDPLKVKIAKEGWSAQDKGMNLEVFWIAEAFGSEKMRWEEGSEPGKRFVDRVIYSGEPRTLDWLKLGDAFFAFGLLLRPANAAGDNVERPSWSRNGDAFSTQWFASRGKLSVSALAKPGPLAVANDTAGMSGSGRSSNQG